MKIYFNGDEHVTNAMATHLSTLLGAEFVNAADTNNTVDQIIYDTKYHARQKPDLIVLGFPLWNRADWGQGQRREYYKKNIAGNGVFLGAMAKHYNNALYNLHTHLFHQGISHVFFNCVTSLRCDRDVVTYDWGNFYIKPYQMTFNYIDWCRYQGFASHKDTAAQQAWAEMLYQHIQQHNLLTKDEHGYLYNLGRQRRRHFGPGLGEWDEELLRPPSE